jgi:hypothetical protein
MLMDLKAWRLAIYLGEWSSDFPDVVDNGMVVV